MVVELVDESDEAARLVAMLQRELWHAGEEERVELLREGNVVGSAERGAAQLLKRRACDAMRSRAHNLERTAWPDLRLGRAGGMALKRTGEAALEGLLARSVEWREVSLLLRGA